MAPILFKILRSYAANNPGEGTVHKTQQKFNTLQTPYLLISISSSWTKFLMRRAAYRKLIPVSETKSGRYRIIIIRHGPSYPAEAEKYIHSRLFGMRFLLNH